MEHTVTYHLELVKVFVELIFSDQDLASIKNQVCLAEKKRIADVYETRTKGELLIHLNNYSTYFSYESSQYNLNYFCNSFINKILYYTFIEEPGNEFYSKPVKSFLKSSSDFISIIIEDKIKIIASNSSTSIEIDWDNFKLLISGTIKFSSYCEWQLESQIEALTNTVVEIPDEIHVDVISDDKPLLNYIIQHFKFLEIEKTWNIIFLEISQFYFELYNNGFYSKSSIINKNQKIVNYSQKRFNIFLTDFLKESSKTYQELFEQRSNQFLETTEATLTEFIELEIDFFEKCRYDLENHEASTDGYSKLGIETFNALNTVINEIGYETFHFATKRKFEFLELNKQKIIQENAIYLNFGDDISIDDGDHKLNKKQKTKKSKESLDNLSQKDFFKKVRNGKLTQLEIHHKTGLLTNDFDVETLQLLYKDFDFYVFFEKEDFGSSFSDEDLLKVINDYKAKGKELPIINLPKLIERKGFKPLIDKEGEQIIDREKLLFPFEFFHCYQYLNYLVNEINKFSSKLPFRDYSKYNIAGPQHKYNINYNALVNQLSETFDVSVIDNILNTELHKLKKINKEGYENNKGDFYNTYKSRANWIETTILICDNEYKHTNKLAFKTAIKWCEEWRERYLPLFDPYSPDEKEAMHKDLFKPLWQQLSESDKEYKGDAIKTDSVSNSKNINGDKIHLLITQLNNYGFNELDKIQAIISANSNNIYQLLIDNDLPYKIALLDHLGFISHLQKNHCNTKDKTYSKLSEILKEDYRSIKGNCLVLNPISKENRIRYTAHNHKENAERDYQNLK